MKTLKDEIKKQLEETRRLRVNAIQEWNDIKTKTNHESRSLEDNETYMLGQIKAYEEVLNLMEEGQ